jgi:hypothetical protein
MTSNGKLFIGEPPSKKAAPPSNPGFRSPDILNGTQSQELAARFNDDVNRLARDMMTALPEAIRRVVRDNWQRTLLGTDFHQAFVVSVSFLLVLLVVLTEMSQMNASIHHSVPSITKRAIRDFGAKMVNECKEEIVKHLTMESLDQVSDLILKNASEGFLDKCLAFRLQTIEATPLINALAKAERLGFESGDIVDQGVPNEQVIQHEQPNANNHYYATALPNGTQSSAPSNGGYPPHRRGKEHVPAPDGELRCPQCARWFEDLEAYQYVRRSSPLQESSPVD